MKPAERIEWIETNGLGGYAFGTAAGYPTRRYHGLLIAALKPPVDRRMLFGGLHAVSVLGEKATDLDPAPGRVDGGLILDFSRNPFPTWTYKTGPRKTDRLVRTVFMRHGHNMTVIRFRLARGAAHLALSIRPLPAIRDHNDIDGESRREGLTVAARRANAREIIFSRGGVDAFLFHSAGRYVEDRRRIGPIHYPWETRQGMEDRDWFDSPGRIAADLAGGDTLDLILSDRPAIKPSVDAWQRAEETRRRKFVREDRPCPLPLAQAADAFLVTRTAGSVKRRQKLRTIVAGYPWFTDWGRDTMISLEGLALVRGEFQAAQEILAAFAGAESQGMIPNHYPEADAEPHFNTVDASLLFFEAGWKFLMYSGRAAFVRRVLVPHFESILRHHIRGTRFNIHADPKTGLLFSGERGTQLTWMDAKVGDWVVTPRHGYPVEIQAMWFNALKIFSELTRRFRLKNPLAGEADRIADRCRAIFQKKYWFDAGGYLYDCLTPDEIPVADLRPNQLFALSLTHPILDDRSCGHKILAIIRKKLLTPVGLRTLSPDHPGYKGRHEGDRLTRDTAYHQGTVWPWLIGPYARACIAVEGRTRRTRDHLLKIIDGFRPHLRDCVLGTISEIMDGDPPHDPKACVAQAWSVAELNVVNHEVTRRPGQRREKMSADG